MEIYKSKVMGFCYGVKRAMKIAENAANSGIKAVTYGPIIHNPQVVGRLSEKGVHPVEDLDTLTDETVIIRSHGVGPSCYNKLKCKNLALMDATCPFVKRNQEITKDLVADGKTVVLIGEKKHPEMKAGYRVPFGWVIPSIAVIASVWLLINSDVSKLIAGLGAMLVVAPLYFVMKKVTPKNISE